MASTLPLDLRPSDLRLLMLPASGKTYHEMAGVLGYKSGDSVKTVAFKVIRKLGAANITQAVAIAIATGAISPQL